MTDQTNDLAQELREAEAFEAALTRLFASLQPPYGAKERLLARLTDCFHESQLTLHDTGPYSFEQHAAQAEQEQTTDLLAAGLEEENPEEDETPDQG